MDAAQKMDAQYRIQRYVYDASRKFYLFGRDAVLAEIALTPSDTLLDVGCGTARNLRILAKRYPDNIFYGVDASALMLETAKLNLIRSRLETENITLKQGLAQQITPSSLGHDKPFDHILFSFVLSMIPNWQEAVEQAIENLKPGGYLHIVDFSDQGAMPRWFRSILQTWLRWFHVHPDPKLPFWLESLEAQYGGQLSMRQLGGRYAVIAHYRKARQR